MASDLSNITAALHEEATKLQPGNESQRLALLESARALVREIEKPHETIMRMCYHDHALFMATKVLGDLGVFKQIASASQPMTAVELAKETSASQTLLERLLKHCSQAHLVHETGPDTYAANDVTRCLATPGAQGAVDDTFQIMKVVGSFPDFLKETQYANPTDKDKSPWKHAYASDQHFFEYINTPGRERNLEAFLNHMEFKTVGMRWFEVPEIMSDVFGGAGVRAGDVQLIDVGGNGGHDLLLFRQVHPSFGRTILQDLPTIIQSLDTDKLKQQGIEAMGHDFFTPQPVHGAKAYYLKMCLHDWPDEQCKKILEQLVPALTPGYSRILLDEIVIPEVKAGWFETSVDLLMMEVHSAQERRERQWRALVDGVPGLQVKKIWNLDGASTKLIEIVAV